MVHEAGGNCSTPLTSTTICPKTLENQGFSAFREKKRTLDLIENQILLPFFYLYEPRVGSLTQKANYDSFHPIGSGSICQGRGERLGRARPTRNRPLTRQFQLLTYFLNKDNILCIKNGYIKTENQHFSIKK
jgi:hypothetical protein